MQIGEARMAYGVYTSTLTAKVLDNRRSKTYLWTRSLIRKGLVSERAKAASHLTLTDRVRLSLMAPDGTTAGAIPGAHQT